MNPIDIYIEAQKEEIKPLLKQVQQTLTEVLPQAKQKIAWNMPTFHQGKNLIHFAAFKNHLGIYPGELSNLLPFQDRLKGLNQTKGAIQFPYNQPIDFELIAGIALYRLRTVGKIDG